MHKELITFTENLVENLVKQPDMVSVQEFGGDDETILLEIIVHESDMGAIIGRSGKMANAIRTMVQAYAFLHKLNRVKINIDSF
ncbi:MAG: KH domain-containing protein [Bacilli bacterium]|nr:KH domain-containing protein [Bacilli bacterium]